MDSAPYEDEKKVNPGVLLDMNYAFSKTALLIAAVRLHLFSCMEHKSLTSSQIASLIGTHEQPTQRLLMGLVSLGFLTLESTDTYRLSAIANQFLVEGKPSYLGGDTLGMLDYIPAWLNLEQTLLTSQPYRDLSQPQVADDFFAPRVQDLFPLVYPVAQRTLARLSLNPSSSSPFQILDVAAGSAPWSAPFAQKYPQSHVTALDLPAVVDVGKKQIAAIGLSNQYTWIAADAESFSFPVDAYDLVVIGHLFRFIGATRSRQLLLHLFSSMRSGATLIISDVFLADDLSGPPAAINLNLSMLVNTAHGTIPTCQAVSEWLASAGFSLSQRLTDVGPFPVLIAQK